MTSDYMIKGYGYSLGVVEIEPIKAASLREAKETAIHKINGLPKHQRKAVKKVWLEKKGGEKIKF